ncbi:MAG: branched-chain amino acid ABC transporter permease [Rhodospirillales bacterium]|nr:branched-chain amino acid ABC transporter permease [Rhodospirillales bacterium]
MASAGLVRGTLAAVTVVVLAAGPEFLRPSQLYLVSLWAVTAIAAMGLNLTLGYAGQISMAQGAFVGIGAYTVALLMQAGLGFFPAFLAAGVLCFAVGWLLGYPALRVQHHYLAFVTLAFTTLVYLLLRNEQWLTNGVYGISGIQRPTALGFAFGTAARFYYFCLGIMALFLGAMWWMIRSPWGRAFMVLRENPVRALSLGVDTRRYTLLAFAIGSAVGGFAGGLFAPLVQFLEPNSFSLGYSLSLLLMVIVGGAGYLFGPLVGAAVAILLPDFLRFTEGYYLLLYAAAVMVLMAFCPQGLIGLSERWQANRRARLAAGGER